MLNGAMTALGVPLAYEGDAEGLALKGKGSDKERDFIDALSVPYVKVRRIEAHPAGPRIRRGDAEAQRKIPGRSGCDDAHGDALFCCCRAGAIGTQDFGGSCAVLEAVLAKDIKPGAVISTCITNRRRRRQGGGVRGVRS